MGDEGVAGEFVFFTALEDCLDPVLAVVVQIAGTDSGRGAVHDDIGRVKQLFQPAGDRYPSRTHLRCCFLGRCMDGNAQRHSGFDPVVRDYVADIDEFHIRLGPDCIGDAFADDPVPVDGDSCFSDMFVPFVDGLLGIRSF